MDIKTCQWYESIEQPTCGGVATHSVTVKTKITSAKVNLCGKHKAKHDENFARARKTQPRK